jgi:SpoVK/Ycf46/Vps4 family AAA+-type ATPase
MIAKTTGRDIMNFQVSEAKSMFYGESQKLVQKAFSFYREAVEKSTIEPILLLNEADSILSKRRNDGVNSAVSNTENAIQTLILNAMEDMKGVMIATTNLQNHFDDSFYRRFLIKKKFGKPDLEVRKQIWADKLPWLTIEETDILSKYEITGGIIENVQRKLVLMRALYGNDHPDLERIIKYVDEEYITKAKGMGRIGFVK